MTGILIACSSCGASLRLRDASLTGKRVRCTKCGARFVAIIPQPTLGEPDEVPLHLAEPAVPTSPPMIGTSARWVPDVLVPVLPHAPVEMPTSTASELTDPNLQGFLASDSLPEATETSFVVSEFAANPESTSGSVIDRVKNRRRRSFTKSTVASITLALIGITLSGIWFLKQQYDSAAPVPGIQSNIEYQASVTERAASNDDAKKLSPTSGKPIPVDYLPFTPQVLFHLHPSELWKEDLQSAEFQALLSTSGTWLKEQIRTRTRFEPEEISELTFAINFGPRTSTPDVAAVVRLKSPQTDPGFMQRFKGRIHAYPGVELYEAADFSYMKIDDRTFAVAPSNMSELLATSMKAPALMSSDLAPLIQQSDQDRLLSLLFDLRIVDSHREEAFISQLQPLADKFLFWFGEDVQTISWSVQLEPNLYMETLLHQTQGSTPAKLQRSAQAKLSRLPVEILEVVRKMRPTTIGSRNMIGRFPAMIKALEIGTTSHIDSAGVRLVTLLPQHATANLVAGALLTWNQSLLTNSVDESHLTKTDGATIPDEVADRLNLRILIDFRATPLQEAISYIGDSIRTEIVIDGDALKAAGFTQNMPQTYDLGNVTALKAIDTIFQKYAGERDPMVLVVDEAGKKLLFSTASKVKASGLTTFETAE